MNAIQRSPSAREQQRQLIQNQIALFLMRGGKIKQLRHQEPSQRPVSSIGTDISYQLEV